MSGYFDPVDPNIQRSSAQIRGAESTGISEHDRSVLRGENPPFFVSDPTCVLSLGQNLQGVNQDA